MKDDLIEVLTSALTEDANDAQISGVVVGKVFGFDGQGRPLVEFSQSSLRRPLFARTTVALEARDIGREVTLVFEEGDAEKPIIIGVIQPPKAQPENGKHNGHVAAQKPFEVQVDNERLTFTAQQEIVLRCGKASLTLTRAGKIILRGKYLLSRSSGVNRIKGGSVQIN
ncbi:hypothetical protein HUU05_07710 [candidate division KSB1 bacterium]|nr:hypothetical protein [candidate division KSB1 bacterium]